MMEKYAAADTMWVLIGAFMVFFMQPGFAMVETGFTRAKNAGNIVMKNFMDLCLGVSFFGSWLWPDVWHGYWRFNRCARFFCAKRLWGVLSVLGLFYLSNCFLCYGGDYCIRCYGRTDEVFCLLYLQYFDQRGYLSGLGALDLGRRLAWRHGFS